MAGWPLIIMSVLAGQELGKANTYSNEFRTLYNIEEVKCVKSVAIFQRHHSLRSTEQSQNNL